MVRATEGEIVRRAWREPPVPVEVIRHPLRGDAVEWEIVWSDSSWSFYRTLNRHKPEAVERFIWALEKPTWRRDLDLFVSLQ